MRPRSPARGLVVLGQRIAAIRRMRNWTQEGFARRIGANYKHLQQIEYGKVNISALAIFRIANALQVPAMTLFDPSASEPKPLGRPPEPRSKAGDYQRSRYRGVYGRRGLWHAHVGHRGKRFRYGPFTTQRAAALAYDAAAKRLKGDRARLNFPSQ